VLGLLYEKMQGWYFLPVVCVIAIYASLPFFSMHVFRKGVWRCLWIFAAFLFGIFHMQSQSDFRSAELARIYDGENISLCGKIYKKEIKNDQLLVYLNNCYAVSQTEPLACNNVLLYQTSDDFSIGDTLLVNGKVNMFQSAGNEGAFDKKSYYFSQKLDFYMKNSAVSLMKPAENGVSEALWHLRARVSAIYAEATDAVTAGVLSVMLLGEKSGLDADVKELYQSMGISHILAISGLHVSLIGLGIYRFLRRRGMRYLPAFSLSAVLLFLYAMMTGCSVSTIRAVGMLFFLMAADLCGRAYDSVNALGGMVLYLLWKNPFLTDYAGFTLSVFAVLGVATIGTALQVKKKKDGAVLLRVEEEDGEDEKRQNVRAVKHGKEKPGRILNMMNAAYMGVGIWMFTLPLIAYYYYEIPIYSALLNLFVVPLLKYLILLGAAGAVVGVGLGAGKTVSAILLPCCWILNWYDTAATACLNLPLAQVIVGKPSVARMIIYYAMLAVFGLLWAKKKETHWIRLSGIAVTLAVLLVPSAKSFEVDVLDVGQGDGTYICTEEGVSLFIDGGSSNVSSVGTYQILPFLKSKGVKRISYWFVSHADLDHTSGLTEVLESGYAVDNLVVAAGEVEDDSSANLAELAKNAGANVIFLKTGDMLDFGKTKLTCLAPEADNNYTDRNDACLVLLYHDSYFSGMFAGDIPSGVEDALAEQYQNLLDIDFYKANHHGSKYSSSETWLFTLTPDITTISCSSTNTYGHPHTEALDRLLAAGTEIYRTDELGRIRLTVEDGEIVAAGYRQAD
jgi:competence protein ComEC